MNDYRDFLPFLRREIALLEQSRFELTFHQMHRVLAGDFADHTDAVIREFLPELVWPHLEDHIRFELCLRLSLAVYWIEQLLPDYETDETLTEFLDSTLIEYWLDDGRNRWMWEHYIDSDQPWH